MTAVDRAYVKLMRWGLMFGLSVLLVAGFYFHAEFYALGLYPLLVIGGFVTLLVVLSFRIVMTGEIPRGRPSGNLVFPLGAGNAVANGGVEMAIVPQRDEAPTVGRVVRAMYPTGAEFGRLLVLDATRKFLDDITDEDARMAGYNSAQVLLSDSEMRLRLDVDTFGTLVRFRFLGKKT